MQFPMRKKTIKKKAFGILLLALRFVASFLKLQAEEIKNGLYMFVQLTEFLVLLAFLLSQKPSCE